MQSDPTGKTQATAERPACPATLHRPREHNTIRPHAEDASERRGRRAQQVRAGPASAARGSIQRSRRCYSPSGPSSAAIHPCGPYRICNPSQRQVQRCKHCGTRGGRPAGLTALRPRVGKGGPSSSARPPRGNKRQPGGAYGPPPTRRGRRPVQHCQTKGAVGPTPPLQVQERQGCGRPIPTPAALEPTAKAVRTTAQGGICIYTYIYIYVDIHSI